MSLAGQAQEGNRQASKTGKGRAAFEGDDENGAGRGEHGRRDPEAGRGPRRQRDAGGNRNGAHVDRMRDEPVGTARHETIGRKWTRRQPVPEPPEGPGRGGHERDTCGGDRGSRGS